MKQAKLSLATTICVCLTATLTSKSPFQMSHNVFKVYFINRKKNPKFSQVAQQSLLIVIYTTSFIEKLTSLSLVAPLAWTFLFNQFVVNIL